MMSQPLKLVATDLDGTFLRNDKSVTAENIAMLRQLGEIGVCRVIATGRNFKKTREVIAPEIPFDYAVFSSGAGVYDLRDEQLIYHRNLDRQVVQQLIDFLISRDLNFHLFRPVPENYKCWYHRGSVRCDEFESYFDFHQSFAEPLPADGQVNSDACQFLVVFPNELQQFISLRDDIQAQFPEVKVVRTSSPLETGYIWMEIFHESVSKGNGVKVVCDLLNIEPEYTLGIGNDFNDLDLLEFTNYSYIVDNGPVELKDLFRVTDSNENHAFVKAVSQHI